MSEKSEQVREFVRKRLNLLSENPDRGSTKAVMSSLRRGAGHKPGELPDLWGVLFQEMPEALMGKKEPSYGEWAVYAALTLFSVHQQGHAGSWMNREGEEYSFGKTLRRLVNAMDGDMDSKEDRVRQRLNRLVVSTDMEELVTYMRGIVTLLSRYDIKLDYPQLAADFYSFQFLNGRENVLLKWGRDFYKEVKSDKNITEKEQRNEK